MPAVCCHGIYSKHRWRHFSSSLQLLNAAQVRRETGASVKAAWVLVVNALPSGWTALAISGAMAALQHGQGKLILETTNIMHVWETAATSWTIQLWKQLTSSLWWRPNCTSGDGRCCSSSASIPWATHSCGCSTASSAISSCASIALTLWPLTGCLWSTSSPTSLSLGLSCGCSTIGASEMLWWWDPHSTALGLGSRRARLGLTCLPWPSLDSLCVQWPQFISWASHPDLHPCGLGSRRYRPPAPLAFWEIRCVFAYILGSQISLALTICVGAMHFSYCRYACLCCESGRNLHDLQHSLQYICGTSASTGLICDWVSLCSCFQLSCWVHRLDKVSRLLPC